MKFRTEYLKGSHNYTTVMDLIVNNSNVFMSIISVGEVNKRRKPLDVIELLRKPNVRMFRYFDHSIRVIEFSVDGRDIKEYLVLHPVDWSVKYG